MNYLTAFFSGDKRLDDWLSPILVKELRQGMRARVFVISFLLLQVFLIVLVMGNLAAQDDRTALQFQSGFFWVIIGFVLLALMPLRGLVAVSQEIKNHTMETIMLTRLTAWRVVFGKWSALFAQSLLLVSAALPYVILRYFIGGDDIVSDFCWILFMLWLSGILIAASIAVSALGNPVIRIAILIGVIVLTANGADDIFYSGLSSEGGWEILGWAILFGFFVPALLFELTTTSIAPASENHAMPRRLFGLFFFSFACGLAWITHGDFPAGIIVPLIVLIGICYFDLAEKPRLLPRMIQSLSQRGWLGKMAAFFLLPGWPTALLFSLVVIPAALGISYEFAPPDPKAIMLLPALFGSVLMPIFICHFFWTKMNQVLLMVLLYNIILLAVASILEGFASLTHTHIEGILAFLPSFPVLLVTMNNQDTSTTINYAAWTIIGNGFTVLLLILLLLVGSRKYFRELMVLLRSAPGSPTKQVPS